MPIDNLYEMPPVANIALMQGALDVLILKELALQRMHGLGIARRIAQTTNGTFQVNPGSLFPALHRMEKPAGSLRSGGNRRTSVMPGFIASAKIGGRKLKQKTDDWRRISAAPAVALEI